MPRWIPPDGRDESQTWRWVDDGGRDVATVRPESGAWIARSLTTGVTIGKAGSRRAATAMLSYDPKFGAVESEAHRRRRGEAQRVVAIRALGFEPEEGKAAPERYAADTGELLSWARETKSAAELDAEVDAYLIAHGDGGAAGPARGGRSRKG